MNQSEKTSCSDCWTCHHLNLKDDLSLDCAVEQDTVVALESGDCESWEVER